MSSEDEVLTLYHFPNLAPQTCKHLLIVNDWSTVTLAGFKSSADKKRRNSISQLTFRSTTLWQQTEHRTHHLSGVVHLHAAEDALIMELCARIVKTIQLFTPVVRADITEKNSFDIVVKAGEISFSVRYFDWLAQPMITAPKKIIDWLDKRKDRMHLKYEYIETEDNVAQMVAHQTEIVKFGALNANSPMFPVTSTLREIPGYHDMSREHLNRPLEFQALLQQCIANHPSNPETRVTGLGNDTSFDMVMSLTFIDSEFEEACEKSWTNKKREADI